MGSCSSTPPDPKETTTEKRADCRSSNVHNDERTVDNCQPRIQLSPTGYLTEYLPHWFPASNAHKDISSQFIIKHKIGDGVSGSVFSILYPKTKQICALKRISRNDKFGRMQFITEARCLSKFKHESIIKYIDMLMDNEYFYLIMEKCDYDLWKLMKRKKYLSEYKTKHIIYSLLGAVSHLHKRNLVHQDIKPENIVFSNDNKIPKLIDFGDAEIAKKDKIYTEFVGTPQYMSPERLGKYDALALKKSDIWSLGVVAYEMYSGESCFAGDTQKKVFYKILCGKWEWNLERIPSRNMQDFVRQCLDLNVEERLCVTDALKHVWFADMDKKNILCTNNCLISSSNDEIHENNNIKSSNNEVWRNL